MDPERIIICGDNTYKKMKNRVCRENYFVCG